MEPATNVGREPTTDQPCFPRLLPALFVCDRFGATYSKLAHPVNQRCSFIPKRSAAPFRPPTTQLLASSARTMRSRSTSARPLIGTSRSWRGVNGSNSATGARSTDWGMRITARSTNFCNSLTFPGQDRRCLATTVLPTNSAVSRRTRIL
jgi:hypothetical protein